jgi:hypothetical protein
MCQRFIKSANKFIKLSLEGLMLHLFRRKIFLVIKYFQQNYFLEKIIFLKIFSGVWFIRKNNNDVKRNPATSPDSGQFRRNSAEIFRFRQLDTKIYGSSAVELGY